MSMSIVLHCYFTSRSSQNRYCTGKFMTAVPLGGKYDTLYLSQLLLFDVRLPFHWARSSIGSCFTFFSLVLRFVFQTILYN